MSWAKTFEALAPVFGTAAGALAAPFTAGLSIPAGMAVGGALGGAVSGGLSLLDNPSIAGASPNAIMNADRANYTAGRLASGQGLTDTTYNRYMNSAVRGAEANIGATVGLGRELSGRISPLLIEGLTNKMMTNQTQLAKAKDDILSKDISTEVNNLKASLNAGRNATVATSAVDTANKNAEIQRQALADNKMKAFAGVMKNLTSVVSGLSTKPKTKKYDAATDEFLVDDIKAQKDKVFTTPSTGDVSEDDLANASDSLLKTIAEKRKAANDVNALNTRIDEIDSSALLLQKRIENDDKVNRDLDTFFNSVLDDSTSSNAELISAMEGIFGN